MKRITETQFIRYAENLLNSELQQTKKLTSSTFIRELHSSLEEIEIILYQVGKDLGFPVELESIRYFIRNGNYNLSDYFIELNRILLSKRNLLRLKCTYFLVYLLAIIAVYCLLNVHILLALLCSSIGSSILIYTSRMQER